jgi:hypothetical protein
MNILSNEKGEKLGKLKENRLKYTKLQTRHRELIKMCLKLIK